MMQNIKLKNIVFIAFIMYICDLQNINSQQYWTQLTELPSAIIAFAINQNNHIFAATRGSGVYRSIDNGMTWLQMSNGLDDRFLYSICISATGEMYVGTISRGVYKSVDGGNYWYQTMLTVNMKIRSIIEDKYGNLFAGSHGRGIYKSTNKGDSWINIDIPQYIFALAAAGNGNIIAGSSDPDAIYLSTDNGAVFHEVLTGEQAFNSIVVRGNNIYSITGSYETDNNPINYKIVYSSNNGIDWVTPNTFANSSFGITMNQSNDVFIGKYSYVFKSTDGGYNFIQMASGINVQAGRLLSICCDSSGYLYLGQEFGNVYKSTETTIGINPQNEEVPAHFKLNQNYPNPFNPSTIINYQIPIRSEVKLSVFDILGNVVSILINQKQAAGSYEIEWNASGFSSGIYFCKLDVNGFSETIPMVFVK